MRALIAFGLMPPNVFRNTACAAYRGPKGNAHHPSIHVVRVARMAAFAAHSEQKIPCEAVRAVPTT